MLLQQAHEYVMVMTLEEATTENPEVNSGTEGMGTNGETTEEVGLGIEMITEINENIGLRSRGRDHPV
jgi:hypothetical protein